MTKDFNSLIDNVYNYTKKARSIIEAKHNIIENTLYKKIILKAQDVHSLISNICKFLDSYVSNADVIRNAIENHKHSTYYSLRVNKDRDYIEVGYPKYRGDPIMITISKNYGEIHYNYSYYQNKTRIKRKIIEQLNNYANIDEVKEKYNNLLKESEKIDKEIEKLKNIISENIW